VGATYCDGTGADVAKAGAVVVGGAARKVTDAASAADDAMLDDRTVGTDGCASTVGADGCASTICAPGMAYVVCGIKDVGWVVPACGSAV